MANYLTTDTELTSVANAIRAKSGGTDPLTFPDGFVSEIGAIPTGGGTSVPSKDVNFYDYDGTRVAAYSTADFAALTALPSNPSHDGLTAQGWNWTLADAKTYVATYGMLDIGQMYITDDGKTRLYITIAAPGRMDVPLYWSQTVANGVTIDWGDGSTAETFSDTGNTRTTHTYASIGDYVITLNPVEGCALKLGNGSSNSTVIGGGPLNDRYAYNNMLKKVELGNSVSLLTYSFANCFSLISINIPKEITTIPESCFNTCYSLYSVIIPNACTVIGSNGFNGCYSLKFISISKTVSSLGTNSFAYCRALSRFEVVEGITEIRNGIFNDCRSLSSLIIPQGVTTLGGSGGITNCYSLSYLKIPQGLASINSGEFSTCYAMKIYDFTSCDSIPTMSNINVFQNIASDCVIKVPAALYDEWKVATNWVNLASHIQSA